MSVSRERKDESVGCGTKGGRGEGGRGVGKEDELVASVEARYDLGMRKATMRYDRPGVAARTMMSRKMWTVRETALTSTA